MVFSSLTFLFVFLPITLLIYFLSPKKIKNFVIMVVSLIFYGWGEPIYIGIMIFAMFFDYTNGRLIEKYRNNKRTARIIFINSLIVSLTILGFFKYYGFLVENINYIFHTSLAIKKIPLPIGISFYTFQSISYIVDVYRGKVEAQKSLISYGTYVTMFPQLVAGPIVRYVQVYKEIDKRKVKIAGFGEGAERFIIGLGKKVLLANNIGLLWTTIKASGTGDISVLTAWLGIIAYTFQIYFDFSGYSDMAIGLGKMLGFNLIENFDHPYISSSITEFWRRWHMSLGGWFREYVYIPLGGNRNGFLIQTRNILIVWFLTGIWHGASWSFIIWGLYFGFFVFIEKLFLKKFLDKTKVLSHIYTMAIVIIGWVFFDSDNIKNAFNYIKVMFGMHHNSLVDTTAMYYLRTNALLFIILILVSTPLIMKLYNLIKEKMGMIGSFLLPAMLSVYFIICVSYIVNETYNPFLYFRF